MVFKAAYPELFVIILIMPVKYQTYGFFVKLVKNIYDITELIYHKMIYQKLIY